MQEYRLNQVNLNNLTTQDKLVLIPKAMLYVEQWPTLLKNVMLSLYLLLATTIDNLKTNDIAVEEILADTHYSSGEALRL